jgi:hypothetical protein
MMLRQCCDEMPAIQRRHRCATMCPGDTATMSRRYVDDFSSGSWFYQVPKCHQKNTVILEAWEYQNGFPGMGPGAPSLQGIHKEPCMLALAPNRCAVCLALLSLRTLCVLGSQGHMGPGRPLLSIAPARQNVSIHFCTLASLWLAVLLSYTSVYAYVTLFLHIFFVLSFICVCVCVCVCMCVCLRVCAGACPPNSPAIPDPNVQKS